MSVTIRTIAGRDAPAAAALIKTRALPQFTKEVRDITNAGAYAGAVYARAHAPFAKGGLRSNIFYRGAASARAPTQSSTGYLPGGRGGGGNWQSAFGVNTLRAPQARFLLQGTGIYRGLGFVHSFSNSEIPSPGYPLVPRRGKFMEFKGSIKPPYRKPIFRKRVLGQKIQDDWWYDAITEAKFVVEARLVFMNQRGIPGVSN